MERAYRFIYGRGGIIDEISAGALDDGWWYECAVGYNTWVTSEFTETAIALMPWGINFRDMHFPQRYTNYIGMRVWERKDGLFGMSFQKWGPFHKNYNTIKNMWNSLLEFADYRGVMFGANDATERMLASEPYELAYYVYRDPAYAAVVKRGKERNLIYGVPELPEDTPVLGTKSVYADNAGIAVLRSQTKDRPQSEQIQAAIKYGTHGSFHGHFDRASLLSIMRYGRYPWNPEATWYGYGSFMYKFWVQPSVSHNMVTVDLKQQKPKESSRMMFYSGEMIQAAVAETNADWENPPFGGITQKHSLAEQCWKEGRYLPIPENAPAYGSVSDRTEPILQRRLLAVTDDYVVLADYIYSGREHVYDNLFHFKGLQEFTAAKKTFVKHTEQFTCDPLSAAQFITNCDWYDVNAPAKFTFEMQWGEGADNAGTRTSYCEDGSLKMDVYSVWPPRASVMVGAYPENHNVNRRLRYQVIGDEKVLAEGKFGAWILGKDKIEVDIKGMNELKLRTSVENARDAETIFWADAKIITNSGKQISLNDLNLNRDNVSADIKSGLDYKGGPVVIQGQKYNDTLAADPIEDKEPGLITVDLKKLGAVKFVASIGGDYPVGDETWRRKTVSIRTKTKATMFLTVIEPYEDQPMIESAVAMSPFDIEVKLKDGRTQNLTIENLHLDHMDISVNITETKNGEETRKEVATSIIYQ